MKLYLIMVGLSFSCCSPRVNIAGKYVSQKFGSIEFLKDSTYYYEGGSYSLFVRSKGEWDDSDDGKVFIFSDIRSTSVPLVVEAQEVDSGMDYNELGFGIKLESGELIDYQCAIFVNNMHYLTQRCDSLGLIKLSLPLHSIYFKILKAPQLSSTSAISPPLVTDVYRTGTALGNKLKFKFHVDDSKFFYQSFDGYPLKVGRKHLYFLNLDNLRWERLRKVSDSAKIFSGFGKTF